MKTKLIAFTLVWGTSLAVAQGPSSNDPITMVFSDTEVGQVLKAVSVRTGANVVYAAGKDKLPVTLNLTVNTAEEAIRSIASASGLVYRKVGRIFVIAPPAGLRQALEPYGYPVTFTPTNGQATDIAAKLQEAFPYSTVRAAAGKVAMTGLLADINGARDMIHSIEAEQDANKLSTEVVILHKAQGADMVTLLQSLYPDLKVSSTAKPGANENPDQQSAVGLSGPIAQLKLARQTAERLDFGPERNRSEIVYKIYPLRYVSGPSATEFLKVAAPEVQSFVGPEAYLPRRALFNPVSASFSTGTSGTSLLGGGGGSGGSSTGSSSGQNSGQGGQQSQELPVKVGDKAKNIVLKGRAADVEEAMRLLTELDKKPKQVVVEVNVIETSPENDEQVGIAYNWSPFDFIETPAGSVIATNPGGAGFTSSFPTNPAGLGLFSRVPFNFRAVVNAMVVKKTAKILAKPSVQVIDNGQASVFIGDTIRARVTSVGALGAQTTTIEEFPVGIILLIAPRVNADGNITLHVNPVVSTVTSLSADNVPQTSAREAETTAIVKSGETVVLGGLIRDEDIKTIQEVPFLSRLPIIGELFKSRSRNHRRNDIIVSITPHILDDERANK